MKEWLSVDLQHGVRRAHPRVGRLEFAPFTGSLTFKIGALIVLAEMIILMLLGLFYIRRFHGQIDLQVSSRVELPGTLMNSGMLAMDAVEDKMVMERLVGRELVRLTDSMIVGDGGNIFHALDSAWIGRDVSEVPGFDVSWISTAGRTGFVQGTDRVSVTPLSVDGQTPPMFLYVKVSVAAAEAEKASITRLFALGSVAAVILTSVVILLLFRSMILARFTGLSATLRRVGQGDFGARVEGPISGDEIGVAERGVNAMAEKLQGMIGGLDELEAERQQLISRLEARNAELERFTYTVSHDLKAPLVTIKGFLGLLKQDLDDADLVEKDIRRISDAADRMRRLLDELLELSRIGRMMNPPEEVPAGELAHEAAELVAGRRVECGAEIVIAPDLPVVVGDRVRLLEVFQNLLDNAVKYMGNESQPRVEVGTARRDDETVFFVRDNGIGLEEKYREKIFGLFARLDPSGSGTGIGLALVKRIVEVHGGRVWAESEGLCHGTTFFFTLGQPEG